MGVRRVRDASYWGVPAGTVITPGMKPRKSRSAAAVMGAAAPARPATGGTRPGSAAAAFAAGAGKGRLHARTSRPMGMPVATERQAVKAPPDPKMAKLSDEQLRNGLAMHGTNTPTGRKVVAEIQRRPSGSGNSGRPKTARGAFDSARANSIASSLRTAQTRAEAEALVRGLTVSQMRAVAASAGVSLGSKDTKAHMAEKLVQVLVQSRLNSAAIRKL